MPTMYVAPRTALEAQIADLWKELLGLERISVYDNFFDIGGNSLTGGQLVLRIQANFGVDLPLHIALTAETLADQTKLVEAAIIAEEALLEGNEDLTQMIEDLEHLSDAEAKELLAQKDSTIEE